MLPGTLVLIDPPHEGAREWAGLAADHGLASIPRAPRRADTAELTNTINTGAAVGTGIRRAFIDV